MNELVEPTAVKWIVAQLAEDPAFEFFCLVDSTDGVDLLSAAVGAAHSTRPLPVLIELGIKGGRAGCRTLEQAKQVATAVGASANLRLVGIEGFESVVEHLDPADTLEAVDAFLLNMRSVAEALAGAGAWAVQHGDVGQLEGGLHRAGQVVADRVQVDRVLQTGRELGYGLVGVVTGAVEPAVDRVLHPPPHRCERAAAASVEAATATGELNRSSCPWSVGRELGARI